MQIIEEKIILANAEFTKSELIEIASLLKLGKDLVTYHLVVDGSVEKKVEIKDESGKIISIQTHSVPAGFALRQSKAIQKAMKAHLFNMPDLEGRISLTSELQNAIMHYRGIK